MENTDKNRKKRWLLLLLLLGVLFCRKKPQTTDTAPAPESSVSTSDGGGTVSLTYSDAAGIDLTAGQVTLLFANPEKSGWDASVRLVVGDSEAARSELLTPGEQVTQLALLDGAEKDGGQPQRHAEGIVLPPANRRQGDAGRRNSRNRHRNGLTPARTT